MARIYRGERLASGAVQFYRGEEMENLSVLDRDLSELFLPVDETESSDLDSQGHLNLMNFITEEILNTAGVDLSAEDLHKIFGGAKISQAKVANLPQRAAQG
ncbi:hypothetical protein HOF92_08790 [bacterium]|jgi:hypothetical protein|nr:hypothetical protein [bacterium]